MSFPLNPDFAQWTERIGAGDHDAEEAVVRWFQPRLQTYFLSRTRNQDASQELVQEALIAILCAARAGTVNQSERLDGFAFGVARNLLMNRFRREAKQRFEPLPEDLPSPAECEPEEADRRREARRAIDELAPADRQILLFTLLDGLKPGEIAAKVGLSSEVVRQRKTRALKRLLDRLRPLSRFSTGTPLTPEGGR